MEPNVPLPGEEAPPAQRELTSVAQALGARIRSERELAGLSVRELARRVEVSHSLISQIERGHVTPSVPTLWSITRALSLSVADLFSDAELRRASATPSGDGRSAPGPLQPHETRAVLGLEGGVRWERLTSTYDDEVDFIHVVYPVGSASCAEDGLSRHSGKEYGYVISGRLGVKLGFETFELGPDDSISFDAMVPHRLWTVGDEPVRAIWTVVQPGQPGVRRAARSPSP
ncbi:MAG TPA: XRE family transcriptional regulator [Gaiella sp.]|jgi:transcriptional regulator with XRE-family HTH domain